MEEQISQNFNNLLHEIMSVDFKQLIDYINKTLISKQSKISDEINLDEYMGENEEYECSLNPKVNKNKKRKDKKQLGKKKRKIESLEEISGEEEDEFNKRKNKRSGKSKIDAKKLEKMNEKDIKKFGSEIIKKIKDIITKMDSSINNNKINKNYNPFLEKQSRNDYKEFKINTFSIFISKLENITIIDNKEIKLKGNYLP